MKPENKKWLEENEHYWITLRDAGYMMGLDGNTRSMMAQIIREEFQPGYATDMWCGPCIADMVALLYRYFNEWREKNAAPVIDPLHQRKSDLLNALRLLRPDIPETNEPQEFFPLPDPPEPPKSLQPVKAAFPSHKKNHRR